MSRSLTETPRLPQPTMPARILVTGSRDWADRELLEFTLDILAASFGEQPIIVVHGGARGADELAAGWARQRAQAGAATGQEVHRADWSKYGQRAGMVRNGHMVRAGADVCVGFVMPCTKTGCRSTGAHDSHGATHCLRIAAGAGVPVRLVRPDGSVNGR